jgi:hypothetical protein
MRAGRSFTSMTPKPFMRNRSPFCRMPVTLATKPVSRLCACFFGRSFASASCSKTVFRVTVSATFFGAAVRVGLAADFLAADGGAEAFVVATAFPGFLATVLGAAAVFAWLAGLEAMESDSPFVCWMSRSNHAPCREASARSDGGLENEQFCLDVVSSHAIQSRAMVTPGNEGKPTRQRERRERSGVRRRGQGRRQLRFRPFQGADVLVAVCLMSRPGAACDNADQGLPATGPARVSPPSRRSCSSASGKLPA